MKILKIILIIKMRLQKRIMNYLVISNLKVIPLISYNVNTVVFNYITDLEVNDYKIETIIYT